MEGKTELLGVRIDCICAKEAMQRALQFLETETLDTIELMSMSMLMKGQENPEWREKIKDIKLILPVEEEILRAAEITEPKKLREIEEHTFLKMFLKYMQKNRKSVFLLTGNEPEYDQVRDSVRKYNRGIQITGHAILEQGSAQEESVINQINGTETDCIISLLPSPYQEEFILKNRALINAKMWLGCGKALAQSYEERSLLKRLRHFWLTRMFRYSVGRHQSLQDGDDGGDSSEGGLGEDTQNPE